MNISAFMGNGVQK